MTTGLYWLPEAVGWRERLHRLEELGDNAWEDAVSLASARLDVVQTNALDAMVRRVFAGGGAQPDGDELRVALLGSSTLGHLHAGIRVAGLRRRLRVDTYESNYGQYWQELSDPSSMLHRFKPNAIVLALDAHHLAAGIGVGLSAEQVTARMNGVCERIRSCWRLAREAFQCMVIHQLALPLHPAIMGNNEHRMIGSAANFIAMLNVKVRAMADEEGVQVLALDSLVARDGIAAWHNPALWNRAKQEINPAAAALFGELVMRLLDAGQGRSYKALVLDLDNTIWGGVVGEDGVGGLIVGEGDPLGEAFLQIQRYARELSRRGVILAVCSKNDEQNALAPFEKLPEMILQRGDIACFVANWKDKPSNLRLIAQKLNIGIDKLVLLDDDPFERALVRRELPMVAVPEVSDDPVTYVSTLADAGYFEALAITDEDRDRGGQYQKSNQYEELRATATDLNSYLHDLRMRLTWRPFDRLGLNRVVQLINKTNQFNMTTRRYSEAEVLNIMEDESAFGVQLRLSDRLSDSGIIAVVIGRQLTDKDVFIDTWLMSCRVLGREVESATLNLLASLAQERGAERLVGEYIPSGKNALVKDYYAKLGFEALRTGEESAERYCLDLGSFVARETAIVVTSDDFDESSSRKADKVETPGLGRKK